MNFNISGANGSSAAERKILWEGDEFQQGVEFTLNDSALHYKHLQCEGYFIDGNDKKCFGTRNIHIDGNMISSQGNIFVALGREPYRPAEFSGLSAHFLTDKLIRLGYNGYEFFHEYHITRIIGVN